MNKDQNFCNKERITEGWYAILKSKKLRVGSHKAITMGDKKLIARRFMTGKVVVTDRYCPHMGTDIMLAKEIAGEKIQCAFHGMKFHESDQKKCKKSKCQRKDMVLHHYESKDIYGLIWVYLGGNPLYDIPKLDITHKWFLHSPSQILNPHHHIVVCNGLDGVHTKFVHTFESEKYNVKSKPYSVTAKLSGKYHAWWMMLLNNTYTVDISLEYTVYGPSIAVADVLWHKTRLYILFTAYQDENNKCRTNTALWLDTKNPMDWLRAGIVVFTILKQDADILNTINVDDNYTKKDTGMKAYRDMVNDMPVFEDYRSTRSK